MPRRMAVQSEDSGACGIPSVGSSAGPQTSKGGASPNVTPGRSWGLSFSFGVTAQVPSAFCVTRTMVDSQAIQGWGCPGAARLPSSPPTNDPRTTRDIGKDSRGTRTGPLINALSKSSGASATSTHTHTESNAETWRNPAVPGERGESRRARSARLPSPQHSAGAPQPSERHRTRSHKRPLVITGDLTRPSRV
jgi:hypothetical protein